MAEIQSDSFEDSIRDGRQRLALELRAQADHIQKLNSELTELQQLHERTEQEANRQWDEITRLAADANSAALAAAIAKAQVSAQTALENVLGAVRALMTCTIPEQVFEVLTEEASQWGVRAAIFDVRGRAAWGASAHGFGPALSDKVLRALIVPLNQDNPFRKVCETAGHVDASADTLKKNRNVLDKLKPAPHAPVLLVPIRSAGAVAAIFYADPGEKGDPLPVNALMILAEFAGAQIDRLIALSGGFPSDEAGPQVEETGRARGTRGRDAGGDCRAGTRRTSYCRGTGDRGISRRGTCPCGTSRRRTATHGISRRRTRPCGTSYGGSRACGTYRRETGGTIRPKAHVGGITCRGIGGGGACRRRTDCGGDGG